MSLCIYIYILDPTRALRARLNLSPSDSFSGCVCGSGCLGSFLCACSSCSAAPPALPAPAPCCSTCSSWSCSCPSTQHIWDKRTSGCSGDLKNLSWSRSERVVTGSHWIRLSSISAETKDLHKLRPSRAGIFLLPEASEESFWRPFCSQAASNSAFGPRLLPGQVVPPLRGGGAS